MGLRCWTSSDKAAPGIKREENLAEDFLPLPNRNSAPTYETCSHLPCLAGGQEREEGQGLGSEGGGAATECLHPWVCPQLCRGLSVLCDPHALWAHLPQGFIAVPAPTIQGL